MQHVPRHIIGGGFCKGLGLRHPGTSSCRQPSPSPVIVVMIIKLYTPTGYDDFDSTPLNAIFPSTGASDSVNSVELYIPIVDDDIDESDEQVFIIFLELINAINNRIKINQNVSICKIIDNESKFMLINSGVYFLQFLHAHKLLGPDREEIIKTIELFKQSLPSFLILPQLSV